LTGMVEHSQSSRGRRRRWPIVTGVLVVLLVIAVGGAGWWFTGGNETWARSRWQPPSEDLLSSMRVKPAPGWQSDVSKLGLPADAKITAGDAPGTPSPVVANQGDRIYLVAQTPEPNSPRWWLLGVDARDGRSLFPPVGLSPNDVAPSCFPNDTEILCVADDHTSATAWVVDAHSGGVAYTGPTDIRLFGDTLRATRAGNHVVAATKGQGLYGVGSKAEPTWFAPGVGVLFKSSDDVVVQGAATGSYAIEMIRSEDGETITPKLAADTHLEDVNFFDGGFAATVVEGGGPPAVQFFDATGHAVNERRVTGLLAGTTANVTAVAERADHFTVYGPTGDKLFDVSGARPRGMQLVGTTLYVGDASGSGSQTYDMESGKQGKKCEFDVSPMYLGTDGVVAVRAPTNAKADDAAKAYNLESCTLAWSIPKASGSLLKVFRASTTLVQLSYDGTRLMSLVTPG